MRRTTVRPPKYEAVVVIETQYELVLVPAWNQSQLGVFQPDS